MILLSKLKYFVDFSRVSGGPQTPGEKLQMTTFRELFSKRRNPFKSQYKNGTNRNIYLNRKKERP